MEFDHKKVEELATLRLTNFTEFLILFYTKLVKKSRKTICQVTNFYKHHNNTQSFLDISNNEIGDFFLFGVKIVVRNQEVMAYGKTW